jgi:hypothetical protein
VPLDPAPTPSACLSSEAIAQIQQTVATFAQSTPISQLQTRVDSVVATYEELAREVSRAHKLEEMHRLLGEEEGLIKRDSKWLVEYSRLSRAMFRAESQAEKCRQDVLGVLAKQLGKAISPSTNYSSEKIENLYQASFRMGEDALEKAVSQYARWRRQRAILDGLAQLFWGVLVLGVGYELLGRFLEDLPEHLKVILKAFHKSWPILDKISAFPIIGIVVLGILAAIHYFWLHPRLERSLLNAQRKDFRASLGRLAHHHTIVLCVADLVQQNLYEYVQERSSTRSS